MWKRLQDKWQVTPFRLVLILIIFSVGGSLCGWLGRQILVALNMPRNVLWYLVYVVLVTILWPFCVLLISIPLGQFNFFRKYILNLGRKMKLVKPLQKTNIAIFASGAGSNAEKIIEHFKRHEKIHVALVVCNKPGAGVIGIAERNKIPVLMMEKEQFFRGDHYLSELQKHKIDWIILAGFLWKIPSGLIESYPRKIINIHPALLPKFGGKGMYGNRVHESVIAAGEKESGITIHFVDEKYDHGEIILQEKCIVEENETAESLAHKIHALEHRYFAPCIEETIANAALKQ